MKGSELGNVIHGSGEPRLPSNIHRMHNPPPPQMIMVKHMTPSLKGSRVFNHVRQPSEIEDAHIVKMRMAIKQKDA